MPRDRPSSRGVEKEIINVSSVGRYTLPIIRTATIHPQRQGSLVWDPLEQKVYVSDGTTWIEVGSITGDLVINGNLTVTGDTLLNNLTVTGVLVLPPKAIPSYRLTAIRIGSIPASTGALTFTNYLDPTSSPSYFTTNNTYTAPVDGIYQINLSGYFTFDMAVLYDFTLNIQLNGSNTIPALNSDVTYTNGATVSTHPTSTIGTLNLAQGDNITVNVTSAPANATSCTLILSISRIE